MQLMLRMGQYYTALYAGRDDRAALLWRQIDTLEQRLEQYYMPLTFSTDCLDLISNDALTRTQLREVIARCRNSESINIGRMLYADQNHSDRYAFFHPYMICAVQWDTLPQKRRPAPFAQFWNGRKLQM